MKLNEELIDNEDLTLEEKGIKNNSVLMVQKTSFFAKVTVPILLAGVMFGAGHTVATKMLRYFGDLVKYAKI